MAFTILLQSRQKMQEIFSNCTEMRIRKQTKKMPVSARTVEGYRDALCEKPDLKSRVGFAMYAIKNQIVNVSAL